MLTTDSKPDDSISNSIVGVEQTLPTLDRTLSEIRTGRRLEKITASIESFLHSQVARLEKAIAECQRSVENDEILQRILADFEVEKQEWEKNRQAEIVRLSGAGEELIKGWEKLEAERQKWSDQHDN